MENLSAIRKDIIGNNRSIVTPFGCKPLFYADYTASGRSLYSIENFITTKIAPYYANTHSDASFNGAQTNLLREQARQQIKQALHANNDDQLIFCGSGATSAINTLIHLLDLPDVQSYTTLSDRPIVFLGPYEHHSNELPWRECGADVITIGLTREGNIDIQELQARLQEFANRTIKIGTFSAASNVTGILSDVPTITQILHQQGALAFWDYAAAGPYVDIQMNGEQALDGVFISPHKFIGGPGTPGVLVVKSHVIKNTIPSTIGGGTVSFVSPLEHTYTDHIETREEGGTPAIIESIRAGLVFKVKQSIGVENILAREQHWVDYAFSRFKTMPNIRVLGGENRHRLPIFSFQVTNGNRVLHHNFVTALMNDLFGIQVRGGCSCAGPYGHSLLRVDMAQSEHLRSYIDMGYAAMKPGWVRFNIPYFIDQASVDYLFDAIALVSEYGHQLIPYYQLDWQTGLWRFQGQPMQMQTTLNDFTFATGEPTSAVPAFEALTQSPQTYALVLATARQLLNSPSPQWQQLQHLIPSRVNDVWFALNSLLTND